MMEDNLRKRTYIGMTDEEGEESKNNSKWNSDYKREIKLLKDIQSLFVF